MRKLITAISLLIAITGVAQDDIPPSSSQPFYDVRYFVSFDTQDTVSIGIAGDTVRWISDQNNHYWWVNDTILAQNYIGLWKGLDTTYFIAPHDLSGIRDTVSNHEDTLFQHNLRLIEVEGLDTTGIYHTNRDLLDDITEADTSWWGTNNYFEKELTNSENSVNVGFTLSNETSVYYNGEAIPQYLWTGNGTTTINLNVDVRTYDRLIIKQ